MFRWGASVLAGLLLLVVVAWSAGWNSAEKPDRKPTEAERIIAYCKNTNHKDSPLCKVDPDNPDAVRDAVRDIIERQTTGPQIIERERETIRDDDNEAPAPRVTVVVPRESEPTRPAPTQPPPEDEPPSRLPIEMPEIPDMPAPDIPVPDLPLIP